MSYQTLEDASCGQNPHYCLSATHNSFHVHTPQIEERTIKGTDAINQYFYQMRIHEKTRCYNLTKSMGLMFSASMLANTFILVYLISKGLLHLNKFTYWNLIMQWCFDLFAIVLICMCRYEFLFWHSLVFLPIVFGDMFLVFVLIKVIILNNDWLLVASSIMGVGTYTVGEIYVADFVIHGLPMCLRFLTLIAGYAEFSRLSYYVFYNHEDFLWKSSRNYYLCHLVWFFISPLLILLIYAISFNPLYEYPTTYQEYFCVIVTVIASVVGQLLLWLVVHVKPFAFIIFLESLCTNRFYSKHPMFSSSFSNLNSSPSLLDTDFDSNLQSPISLYSTNRCYLKKFKHHQHCG